MDYIKFCTDDFLEEFKTNFDNYIDMYLNKDVDKIKEIFSDPKNIKTSNMTFNFIPLKTNKTSKNPERDNIKLVFKSLNELEERHAVQEKLWTAMYNTYYLDHLLDYIDNNINHKNIKQKIKGSILFTQGKKRSQIVQNLSRMWWLGYYLYDDENRENPYWLLDYYTKDKDIIGRSTVFFSSNLTNNKNLRLGIIEGIKELEDEGKLKSYDRYYYVNTSKHLNLLGSVTVLDIMDREEVKEKTKEYLLDNMLNNEE